jgi:hypothetical protein
MVAELSTSRKIAELPTSRIMIAELPTLRVNAELPISRRKLNFPLEE